jgi:hypothetical protein
MNSKVESPRLQSHRSHQEAKKKAVKPPPEVDENGEVMENGEIPTAILEVNGYSHKFNMWKTQKTQLEYELQCQKFEFLVLVIHVVNLQCKGLLFTWVLLFELRERPCQL